MSVKTAERRSVGRSVVALGRCDALPQKQALVTATVEGQVTGLLVEPGASVTAGHPIVQLDTTLGKADLAEKEAARDSLEASARLIASRPRSEEQTTSQLAVEQAKIAVEVAQALVDRLRPLQARNEISDSQLYDAGQALRQAEVQLRTAQAQYDLLMLPPRDEAIAEAVSRVKVAEEAVETAKARFDLQTIRAPIEGVLDSLTCRLGQTITVGSSVGEIVDSREVMAVAWQPVSRIQSIRVGQTATVRSDAAHFGKGNGDRAVTSHAGKVDFVGKIADPQTGNIPVRVQIDNRDGDLVVGQTLSIEIEIVSPTDRLCVPQEAIHDEGDGPAITVVRDGNAVVLHPQLGTPQGGWISVSGSDLREGEPVAVAGAYNLPDGTTVSFRLVDDSTRPKE